MFWSPTLIMPEIMLLEGDLRVKVHDLLTVYSLLG
jgi:hypothetical protein